jgi:hypothetical protein
MLKKYSSVILAVLIFSSVYGQSFNQEEFLYRVKTIYHSLRGQGVENYSSWVTSDLFLKRTRPIYNAELYPLELIWSVPNQIYYIKRPVPVIQDSLQIRQTSEWQMDMLQALKGIMIDWQRFFAGNILDEMPETFLVTTRDDSAYISYELNNMGQPVKVRLLFGLNGICLRTYVSYPDKKEEIYTYPSFRLIDNKWLCTGWTVQALKNREVESGYSVKLKFKKLENFWALERIGLQLQDVHKKDIIFTREYIFKNITVNRDLKIVR